MKMDKPSWTYSSAANPDYPWFYIHLDLDPHPWYSDMRGGEGFFGKWIPLLLFPPSKSVVQIFNFRTKFFQYGLDLYLNFNLRIRKYDININNNLAARRTVTSWTRRRSGASATRCPTTSRIWTRPGTCTTTSSGWNACFTLSRTAGENIPKAV